MPVTHSSTSLAYWRVPMCVDWSIPAGVRVLVVDEPSVGIDIKTKAYVHDFLRQLAEAGTAVLVITSDMPEMIALADRIVVMDRYRIEGELSNTGHYDTMSEAIMGLIHRDVAVASIKPRAALAG